ncbi:hypothetical protein RI367_007652 [Sorochytrium milnesiophthora]
MRIVLDSVRVQATKQTIVASGYQEWVVLALWVSGSKANAIHIAVSDCVEVIRDIDLVAGQSSAVSLIL